jgi:hypothetical protein
MYLNYPTNDRKYILGKNILAVQSELPSTLRDINYNFNTLVNSWKKYVV